MTKPKKKPSLLFTLYLLSVWGMFAGLLLLALHEYFQGKADDWHYLTDHTRFSTPSESPLVSDLPSGQCLIERSPWELGQGRFQEDEKRSDLRHRRSIDRW